jgi:U3 small nucleolar RNA-associated protein 6
MHQTILPPQPEPSVSYARDFWVRPRCDEKEDGSIDDILNGSAKGDRGQMTNVDGLYATDDIDPGTVIFKESDMPDCELHRSRTNPNCEVVELDDGTQAVVSVRKITAGEFFCIAESSDEGEGDEDDDEEEHDVDSEVDSMDEYDEVGEEH